MADSPRIVPRSLAAYAAQLLAGTGLSPAAAARAAAGDPDVAVPPGAESAVQAMHDGWTAAALAALAAEPEPGPETGAPEMGGPG